MSIEEELRAAGVAVKVPLTQSQAYIKLLNEMGYTFAFNQASMDMEVNGQSATETIAAKIRMDMRDKGIKGMAAVEDAWQVECSNHTYHPVQDYFKSLKWDGKDHIAVLCSKLHSDSPIVTYADGSTAPIASIYLSKWLIGAVAKVFRGAQNPMLVLDSPQGTGKSLLSAFFSPKRSLFIEAPINTQDKDCDIRLMSKFIWEVSELDATTRKADVSALKAFLTKSQVTVRKSYGRYDVVGQAMASFIGTINNTAGFLADETGNRRFWIIHLTSIDWSYTQLDIDQIWAQAYQMYQSGVDFTLTPEEQLVHEAINEGYETESALDGWVNQFFMLSGDEDHCMTMGEIILHLTKQDIRLGGNEKFQSMEIGKALKKAGCTRCTKRYKGKPQKVWCGLYAIGTTKGDDR